MTGLTQATSGHGTFIFDAVQTIRRYGSADSVASAVRELNMQHAWVRVHGARQTHAIEPTSSLIGALKAGGIAVAGWGWCQGEDAQRESELAIRSLDRFGLTDYVADIEEGVNNALWTAEEVETFLTAMRAAVSGALGVSSHGFLHFHVPSLMTAADGIVDFFAPQVYWFWHPTRRIRDAIGGSAAEFPLNDPDSYARVCLRSWRSHVTAPIVLTGQAYWGEHPDFTQALAEAKVRTFLAKFDEHDAIVGLNWWHLGGQGQNAMSPDMFNAIREAGAVLEFPASPHV